VKQFFATTAAWVLAATLASRADVLSQRFVHPQVDEVAPAGSVRLRFDLSGLPAGANICRADLVLVRSAPITGADDDALVPTEVFSPAAAPATGSDPGQLLALRAPWFDRLDAADAIRRRAGVADNAGFVVRRCARLDAARCYLDIWYEGPPGTRPAPVKNVRAVHRAGLTFVTWQEIENPFADNTPTLGELRTALARAEADRRIRYRIYRHDRPIDARSASGAELLGEVGPFSAYNLDGITPDHVIHRRQLRALADPAYARSIAREPFDVSPDSPEMADLPVPRFAIEDGKPLPAGTGLYVHQPSAAGKAYYAVVPCIDGVSNMSDFPDSAAVPVAEQTGPGEPVLQKEEDLKVFYDYPGRRLHYVQWCSPAATGVTRLPTANLPNRAYNWSVYVPRNATDGRGAPALGIYFHDWRGLYLRPRWPHETDQILIATGDSPASFGYGYHEALGTLRSWREGFVRDYTAARIDEFTAWVRRRWNIDATRISCHGVGALGGTAAIHYGLRHAAEVSLILAGHFEPQPGDCPPTVETGGRPVQTHLARMEAVWGRRQWNLPTPAGMSIWDDRDLVRFVQRDPRQAMPFLSIGAGTTSAVWPRQARFMKALLAARQPFIADFDWGGSPPRYAPLYVRKDRLMPAVNPDKLPFADREYWAAEKIVYSPGGSINTALTWNPQTVVDTPQRLEVEGAFNGTLTLRNAQRFRPTPGQRLRWTLEGPQRDKPSGQVVVDEHGLVTIPGVGRGRLILSLAP